MELKDRIENIKTLLKYCPNSSRDVSITDEKAALFFGKLFNNDSRFEHCTYKTDRIYTVINLAEHIITRDCNGDDIHEYPIYISYDYCYSREEGSITYYFDEPLIRNYIRLFDIQWSLPLIRYEDIPDEIWEIIQTTIYERASREMDNNIMRALALQRECREFELLVLNK